MRPFQKTLLTLALLALSADIAAETASLQLEEVTVTARRWSENIQKVPVAITVISSESINNSNLDIANDIASVIPNMLVSSPFGENQPVFTIRGVSMADYNTNQGTTPVGVYVDEASIGANFLHGMALFDLERIEVLRGPQSTLYGKNTTSGVVNIVTRAPSLNGSSGDMTLTTGDYGRKEFKGAVETEIVEDKWGIRAAYTYTETDGHHENHFPGGDDLSSIDNWAGRIALRYEGEKLGAILRYSTGESDGKAAGVVSEGKIPVPDLGKTDRVGSLLRQLIREPGWDAWEGSHNKAESYSIDFDTASLTLNWDLGDYSVTSVTSYLEGDSLNRANTDGAPWKLLEVDFGSNVEQFAQDLRLTSNFDGSFNFVTGIYYDSHTNDVESVFELFHVAGDLGFPFNASNTLALNPNPTLPPSGFSALSSYVQERNSFALYLYTKYEITNRFGLTAGIRYTDEEGDGKDFHTQLADYDRNPVQDLIAPGSFPADSAEYDDGELTGQFGVNYQLNDDTLLYAGYSRGYRSSAFNGGALYVPGEMGVADPEYIDAYEMGFKTQLRGRKIQLNGAAFYYDYTDQQIVDLVGLSRFLINAGDSTLYGFELELNTQVTDALTINAGLGYLHTEIDEMSLTDTENGGPIALDGNELFHAPELNFNLALDYVIADIELGIFKINANTVYVDDVWFSSYNDDLDYDDIKSDSSWMSNAKLSWDSAGGTFGFALWVKNIEDNDEPTFGINLGAIGSNYFTLGLPRRMGVDFAYRF